MLPSVRARREAGTDVAVDDARRFPLVVAAVVLSPPMSAVRLMFFDPLNRCNPRSATALQATFKKSLGGEV